MPREQPDGPGDWGAASHHAVLAEASCASDGQALPGHCQHGNTPLFSIGSRDLPTLAKVVWTRSSRRRPVVVDAGYQPMSVDFTPEVTLTALGKGLGRVMIGRVMIASDSSSPSRFASRLFKRGRFGHEVTWASTQLKN